MTETEADRVLDAIHAAFPKVGLVKGGQYNEDRYSLWKRHLLPYPQDIALAVVGEFFDGRLKPGGKRTTPEWSDVRGEIARRLVRAPVETSAQAPRKSLRLPFADGDYVTWATTDFNALAGGIVRKHPAGDYLNGVPILQKVAGWQGYVLYPKELTQPAEVAGLRKMTPEQQSNWTRQIADLQARGELTSFGGLPGLLDAKRRAKEQPSDLAKEAEREQASKARENVMRALERRARLKGQP